MTTDVKVGVIGYPVPDGVTGPAAVEYQIREAARHCFDVVNVHPRQFRSEADAAYDVGALEGTRALADELGLTLEPYAEHAFELHDGDGGAAGRFRRSVQASKKLGGPYVRITYGRLRVGSSRFDRSRTLAEHQHQLIASLGVAAKVAEDEGVVLAVENHCDFSGREWADVLEAVSSDWVRAAFDTGNSWSVFADAKDDLAALLPFIVQTHMKDLRIEEQRGDASLLPFKAIGCPIGDGDIDMRGLLARLLKDGPRGRDLPLIVELAWLPVTSEAERGPSKVKALVRSVDYLRTTASGI